MTANSTITNLIGKDLKNFKVIIMTEAFEVNDDGRKSKSIGYFKDHDIAEAFIGSGVDPSYKRIEDVMVLTDGVVGYVIGSKESIHLFDDEEEAVEIKKKALEKLTPEERKLFGFD